MHRGSFHFVGRHDHMPLPIFMEGFLLRRGVVTPPYGIIANSAIRVIPGKPRKPAIATVTALMGK